jgi:hypothetical protein
VLPTPQILSLFSITEGRWCKLLILRTGPLLLPARNAACSLKTYSSRLQSS